MTTATALTPRQRLARIRDALALADGLLADAYAARDWSALGHASWDAYCAAELPELRMIRFASVDERRERVAGYAAAGLSAGAIASLLGVAKDTAWRDVRSLGDAAPTTVVATDGRRRQARSPRAASATPAPAVPFTERVVALLAEHGPMTAADVRRRTRRTASEALCRLAAAGRIDYTPGARRGVPGLYAARVG